MNIRKYAVGATALALGTVLSIPASHAYAQGSSILLACTGTETDTYNPPITNTTRSVTITVTGIYGSCPIAPDDISGGTYGGSVTGQLSCDSPVATLLFPVDRTFDWTPSGTQSTAHGTITVVPMDLAVEAVFNATVTRGQFYREILLQTVTLPRLAGLAECSRSGVTSVSGPTTLQITP